MAITRFPYNVDAQNAVSHFKRFDLILDCTDHPASRYLISDAAVLAKRPLVSASALGLEGQLLILNNPPSNIATGEGGFCYRCVFPTPPPADSVFSCGEGGILGPVVGAMGTMMASHAISILRRDKGVSQAAPNVFWLYAPFSPDPLRSIRIKGKRHDCKSCSTTSIITEQDLLDGSVDHQDFCGIRNPVNDLHPSSRVSPIELTENFKQEDERHRVLFDVQEPQHYSIASLPLAHNLPISKLSQLASYNFMQWPENILEEANLLNRRLNHSDEVYFICRHGNDSQYAVALFKELLAKNDDMCSFWTPRTIKDVKGGIEACRRDLGLSIPEY